MSETKIKIFNAVSGWPGITDDEKLQLTDYTLHTLYRYRSGEFTLEQLGSFCKAIVNNDLISAAVHADSTNAKMLTRIVKFYLNLSPGNFSDAI
jgi:hypothetical protein